MKSRILALLFLGLLVGIPVLLYWYFFDKNTSSLILTVRGPDAYRIYLEGKLDNKLLPLADNLIRIQQDCTGECLVGPMAPITYDILITSTGYLSMRDRWQLGINQSKTLSYVLQKEWNIEGVAPMLGALTNVHTAIIQSANKRGNDSTYEAIGVVDDILYVHKKTQEGQEIGILGYDGYRSIYRLAYPARSIRFDITGQYFVISVFADRSLIVSRDTTYKTEIPKDGIIAYTYDANTKHDKILLSSGDILGSEYGYGNNPRYRDWVDSSQYQRIATIMETVQSLPSMVIHDRRSGDISTVRDSIDVRFLFSIGDDIFFVDTRGAFWKIHDL